MAWGAASGARIGCVAVCENTASWSSASNSHGSAYYCPRSHPNRHCGHSFPFAGVHELPRARASILLGDPSTAHVGRRRPARPLLFAARLIEENYVHHPGAAVQPWRNLRKRAISAGVPEPSRAPAEVAAYLSDYRNAVINALVKVLSVDPRWVQLLMCIVAHRTFPWLFRAAQTTSRHASRTR